jgi:adenylate kinase
VKRRIVLLGPPASGKGTLADRLHVVYHLPVASPGAMLREEQAAGTPLGLEAAKLTKSGNLVGDDVINTAVRSWLSRESSDGFVFDGFPRTLNQATALDAMLAERRQPLETALLLEAGLDTLRNRVKLRATCSKCGNIVTIGVHTSSENDACPRCKSPLRRRDDDNAETLEKRFHEYTEKTEPVIDYYETRQILERVNTERSPETVFETVREILNH